MVCIFCASPTTVGNSRLQRRDNHVWRRRTCMTCGSTFTTIERPELSGALMVTGSADNRKLAPFSRDRLFLAVYESCKHRADAASAAASLTQTVIIMLLAQRPDSIVSRAEIAERTHLVLNRFDRTAATVYTAYHPIVGTA